MPHYIVTPKMSNSRLVLNNVVTVRFLTESWLLTLLKSDHEELCEVVIDKTS